MSIEWPGNGARLSGGANGAVVAVADTPHYQRYSERHTDALWASNALKVFILITKRKRNSLSLGLR